MRDFASGWMDRLANRTWPMPLGFVCGGKHATEMLSHITSVRAAIARSRANRQGVQHDHSAIKGKAAIKKPSLKLRFGRQLPATSSRTRCDPDDPIRTVEPVADFEERPFQMPGGSGFLGEAVRNACERLSRRRSDIGILKLLRRWRVTKTLIGGSASSTAPNLYHQSLFGMSRRYSVRYGTILSVGLSRQVHRMP
jgi:hypothetical protein